ncbi:MAG: ATP-binding protein [Brevundimonas sp.]|uniref:ATP-binding protein n=1 Tax=Brevundimonas sp. TaxID=1871086 RepID=UPI00391BC4E9
MITLPTSDRETHRVDMVRSFGVLDQNRSVQHEEIAILAQELAQTRWALVTLVDAERIWFTGAAGYAGTEANRWSSFCTHVLARPDEVLWIEDASTDFRFRHMGTMMGDGRIRLYAGAPVVVNGHAVGTVCVFDTQPRPHDPLTARRLSRLATIVGEDLAARHRAQSLRAALLASADALIDCDDRGVIEHWSDGAEQLFGFSRSEALGSNINIIIPAELRTAHASAMDRWRLGGGGRLGRRLELEACRKDGSLVDIELWMSVAHERGVPHIHANIRDISERKAHAAALRKATAEAEAANEAKTTFLTNMSHELRTPLNGVIGIVDLLAQTEQSDHQRELTTIIKTSSDQLSRLIGDILDLARIEAGAVVLESTSLSVPEVVNGVTAVAELAAQEKGIRIYTDLGADLDGRVLGDPTRLKQVLSNLVSNAVKFTDSGAVSIRAHRLDETYTFEVSDTGIGFTPEQRTDIFGRFQQADGTITRRYGGSGLGLAISWQLVDAMGGRLECRSSVGQGSSFWFSILLKPDHLQTPKPRVSTGQPSAGRVLVVDDNATNRRVAELILRTAGIDVACVEDGDQAVDAFLSETFDAILMDMMMPVMDGPTATRVIRDLEQKRGLSRTPIIMLTANTLPQHIELSLEAGADLHLAKPISAPGLFDALTRVQSEPGRDENGSGQTSDAA